MFVTNTECFSPFHVILADAVESCSGSSELITILNGIGAVASIDTLKRVVLSISQDRVKKGAQKLLVERAFTIASADNIDFLQSYAAVDSGCQQRSQLVQPRPFTCTIVSTDTCQPNTSGETSTGECSAQSRVQPMDFLLSQRVILGAGFIAL